MEKNPTIVFRQPGQVVIEELEKPAPKQGELLIQTRRTLISTGTELTLLSGQFPQDSAWSRYGKFPVTPGYDNVGVVVEVGDGVDQDWIGQRVASGCRHAAFVTADAKKVRHIRRDTVRDEEAAFFAIAEIVLNSVRRSNLRGGEGVVIFGMGLLGQLVARCCRLFGARPVLAVDVAESRLKLLPKDASLLPINSRQVDVVSAVKSATRERMADVVFEVTGSAELIPDEFKVLRRQGRFVLLSSPRAKTLFDFHDLCNSPSFTIVGTHYSSHPDFESPDNPWTRQRHAELFFDWIADGEMSIRPLISHCEPYSEACRLYDLLTKDRSQAMGVILTWNDR